MYEIHRRNRIDMLSPAELAIRHAIAVVEDMGADVRLTDAVVLLGDAQVRLADYVDGVHGGAGEGKSVLAEDSSPQEVCLKGE